MNRKRALKADTFKTKKWKSGSVSLFRVQEIGASVAHEGPADIKASLEYLMSLFPRKLFNDTLPPVVLKHQLYSIQSDKTLVDRHLNELREQGEVLMFQLGFDSESIGVVFAADFKAKVLATEAGRETGSMEKFLSTVLPCCDISVDKKKMLKELLFTDSEITQLVKCGVLTVKDAGSWWLSIPNSGKFIKYFIQGRKAVLGMIRKSKYSEMLKSDLEERQPTSQVKFPIKYHIHDVVGAELVDCIQTTAGMLLRVVNS
ncbi:serine/threonine-protein kinase 19 [Arapaima gigas]